MVECFKPADNVMVGVQIAPELAHRAMQISRLQDSYKEPILRPQCAVAVLGAPPVATKAPVKLPIHKVPASPSPRISESDERRILSKMEQLLKNEVRILEVEEENRVLTRMIARLQAENDALKARG